MLIVPAVGVAVIVGVLALPTPCSVNENVATSLATVAVPVRLSPLMSFDVNPLIVYATVAASAIPVAGILTSTVSPHAGTLDSGYLMITLPGFPSIPI